jgi:hypothetical protein
MKNFILGFVAGVTLGSVTVAYASVGVLFGSDNIEKGTDSNPLYVEVVE